MGSESTKDTATSTSAAKPTASSTKGKGEERILDILVATYNSVGDAQADLADIKAMYKVLGTSHNFDAAVVARDDKGKVKIEDRYEAGARHGTATGAVIGLASGLVVALFPAVGIVAGAAVGAGGGAIIGDIVGHKKSGIPKANLKAFGALLDTSQAALIVVYETSLSDQLARNIKARSKIVSPITDEDAINSIPLPPVPPASAQAGAAPRPM